MSDDGLVDNGEIMAITCDVYKSDKRSEMFIYVSRQEGLERVPVDLLERFGEPILTLSFDLTADRKLAKEDSQKVLRNLEDQGYHLQMPPLTLGDLGRTENP